MQPSDPHPSTAIGVDIGGTFTKIALVSQDGVILKQTQLISGAQGDPQPFISELKDNLGDFLAAHPQVKGIGVALAGFLSDDRRSIAYNPNLPALVGIDFAGLLEPFGLPVIIEQDLNAPALAEYLLGVGQGSKRFMTAAIGTGLGAAMLVDGEVLRLYGQTLGDTGHVLLDPQGEKCTAGCQGCAEALASARAVERLAAAALADPRSLALREAQDPSGSVPARAVITLCRQGDPLAMEIIARIGVRLGQWLASLTPIFMPDMVALCGGVATAGEPLLKACRQSFTRLCGCEYSACQIVLGRFGALAGVIGAAAPFLSK